MTIALRLDDVGACSKRYEIYSDFGVHLGPVSLSANWLCLKYLFPFRKWGPYREMTAPEWYSIFRLLESHKARLTVAVTAAWAESEQQLIPFPTRFPGEAAALKEGVQQGLIEVANHGLTHCVLQGDAFKPRWFSSNRQFHREFWDWIPLAQQEEHLRWSQDILQNYFQTNVVTFVPPGNVFTENTLKIAQRYGLRYVSCNVGPYQLGGMVILGNEGVIAFHDRDIVLKGVEWFKRLLDQHAGETFCFLRDLAETNKGALLSCSTSK